MTKGQQPKDIFDVKRIREIIELMEEHDLSAVDLQQGDEKIKLNRGSVSPVYSAPPPVAAAPAAAAPAAAAPAAAADAGTVTVNAPMVGAASTPFGGVKESGIGREGGAALRIVRSWRFISGGLLWNHRGAREARRRVREGPRR